MSKNLIIAFVLCGLAVSSVLAGTDYSAFFWQKNLIPPETKKRDVASVELDEEVLSETTGNYSNLRVFDSNDVETPVLVRAKCRKKSVIREQTVSMKSESLKELPDNKIEIILSQEGTELSSPGAIVFSTALKNFEKQVSVYGSNDNSEWTQIFENEPIFDYSRFFDIEKSRIDMPESRYRYFKLVILNITEKKDSPIVNIARDTREEGLFSEVEKTSFQRKDFRIEKITFMAKKLVEIKTNQITREYTVRDLQVADKSGGRETIVTFSLDNVPFTKLTLITEDSNFSRTVRLEGTDNSFNSVSWKPVAHGTLTKIRMGKFNQNSTSIQCGQAVRYKDYRLVITNHDSPPLKIKELKVEGEVHEAVFFCNADVKYWLLYGGSVLTMPQYDIAEVLRKTDGEDTDAYTLGEQERNPDQSGSGFSVNSKSALVVVIIIMIGVLLWVITKTTKNIEGVTGE